MAGYLSSRSTCSAGETGTAVPQSAATYIERTAGGVTVYPAAAETVYRNTNGTGGQTTTIRLHLGQRDDAGSSR